MGNKTFHYKYIKSPKYYVVSIVKIAIVLTLLSLIFIYFPRSRANLKPLTVVSYSFIIFIACCIYFLTRRYVNCIVLNYDERTIEISYIEPFQECSIKTSFENFNYNVSRVSYDIFRKIRWSVLTIQVSNKKFKISELELSFTLEMMTTMAEEFKKIKQSE